MLDERLVVLLVGARARHLDPLACGTSRVKADTTSPAARCRDTRASSSVVGRIGLGAKQTSERSAGNPHVAFDVAGAGNVAWSRCCDTSQPKGRGNREHTLRPKPERQSPALLRFPEQGEPVQDKPLAVKGSLRALSVGENGLPAAQVLISGMILHDWDLQLSDLREVAFKVTGWKRWARRRL
jgi:hypothetical protein